MRCIALDLGGNAIKAGAMELTLEKGRVVASDTQALSEQHMAARFVNLPLRDAAKQPDGLRALLEQMKQAFAQALAQVGWTPKQAESLGVGLPGTTDSERGVCVNAPAVSCLNDVPLIEELHQALGFAGPLAIGNDVNLATLGEARLGAARKFGNVVMIALGKGIGGGVTIAGEMWPGAHGFAMEIGHLPLEKDGPPCECGKWGCFETLAGSEEIAERARRKIRAGRQSRITELVGGDLSKVEPETLSRAGPDDAVAVETFREVGEVIGRALTCAILLLDPDAVIVGGGVAKAGELLFGPIRDTVRERCMNEAFDVANILEPALGKWAGTHGAAVFGAERAERDTAA